MNKNWITGIIIAAGLIMVLSVDSLQPEEKEVHVHDNETVLSAPPPRTNTPLNSPLGRGVNKGNLGSMNVTIPDGWARESPSSSMRIAQFNLPGDDAGPAELAVYNRIGGNVQQNLERWIGQFTQPDGRSSSDKAELTQFLAGGSLRVDRIYLEGTYSAGAMGGSPMQQREYGLLGYIVIMPDGPYYFKAIGPVATINFWMDEMDAFIRGIQVAG